MGQNPTVGLLCTPFSNPEAVAQGEPATVIIATTSEIGSRTLAQALIRTQSFDSTGIHLNNSPVYQRDSLLLTFFEGTIVNPPSLDDFFSPKAYIFLSRHSAESGIPSLTAHTTGNFSDKAELGGMARELGRADPGLLKDYMIALTNRSERVPDYEITVEATHHGPTSLSRPVLFVELGSTSKQWGDKNAAEVVADALVDALTKRAIWDKVAIGFGGTHYPKKIKEAVVKGEFAVSFIAPKYVLEYVNEVMIEQMIQKTMGPVRFALVDWKGLGPHKEKLLKAISKFGLEVVRL